MSTKSDADLLKIIESPKGDYQEEAFEAAKFELSKRKLSNGQISDAKNIITQSTKTQLNRVNKPLGFGIKLLTFLLPGLLQIILSASYTAEGYDRKARDLVNWTIYGFCFYGLLILILVAF